MPDCGFRPEEALNRRHRPFQGKMWQLGQFLEWIALGESERGGESSSIRTAIAWGRGQQVLNRVPRDRVGEGVPLRRIMSSGGLADRPAQRAAHHAVLQVKAAAQWRIPVVGLRVGHGKGQPTPKGSQEVGEGIWFQTARSTQRIRPLSSATPGRTHSIREPRS
jgi:hypothetical protein